MAVTMIWRRNLAEIGKLVRLLREKQGLSQLQLAARAGVTTTTVRRVERASKTPHRSTLRAIAIALGTTAEKLAAHGNKEILDETSWMPGDDAFLDWDWDVLP